MAPKVSIIILNWNGKNDTLECLESVFRIDYPNFEVILVDNGSSDDSSEAIKSRFKNVILIENKENLGFCAANNQAIKLAMEHKADFFLILNNDTVVEHSIINELKNSIAQRPEIGAVNPIIANYSNPKSYYFYGTKIDWGNGDLCSQYPKEYVEQKKGLLDVDFVTWCTVFIRKEALQKIGLLDEQFFAYYEDTDWSIRCKKSGMRTVLYPKVLVYHKVSKSTGGNYSPRVYFYLFRNRLIFISKHANFMRKLQFSLNYIKDSTAAYLRLTTAGSREAADSIMDALWSGIHMCRYNQRITMPKNIRERLNFRTKVYLWLVTLKEVFKIQNRS